MNRHPTVKKLLADIGAYLDKTGTSRSAFGLQATGDGYLISRIEQGRTPTLDTIEKIYRYMDRKTKAVSPKQAIRAMIDRIEYYPSGRRKPFKFITQGKPK